METLKNIAAWALALFILFLIRKPILRFIKHAGQNAYNRAVAWVGAIIFIVVAAFVIFLLSGVR